MASVKLEVQSIDKVKTLIELLSLYQNELPKKLNDSLVDLADCECCEIGTKRLMALGVNPGEVVVLIDGKKVDQVISINPILKRVTHSFGGFSYPKSASITDESGSVIHGW